MDKPAPHSHEAAMSRMHQRTLWTHFAVILLGCWCLTAPAILGYGDSGNWGTDLARVAIERNLPAPDLRSSAMIWSDVVSGILLIGFGTLSVFRRFRFAQWGSCFTGIWLLAAPLVFWAPDAASYASDTLVGAFAITLSVLVPMMPGMSMEAMSAEEDIPPGWSYSPSSWPQRLPIIALAFVGFFIARYMAAYQMGHIASVWDPFFDQGTARIITSDVSRAWPVPDAGLGAMSYLLEGLSGAMGDRRRWRTMPWMVAMFGVLVVPLGAVSIFFIIIQPIMIGTWCTLCLLAAAAMVLMLPYTFDEIVAMLQFLLQAKREGQSLWQVFWHGGTIANSGKASAPTLPTDPGQWLAVKQQASWLPKALFVSAALGIWLMFTRLTFGTSGALADSDHLVGSLVFTFSVSAFAETVRPLRAINMLFGVWLIVSPWILSGGSRQGAVGDMAVGALLLVLALPRGPIVRSYGAWNRYLAW